MLHGCRILILVACVCGVAMAEEPEAELAELGRQIERALLKNDDGALSKTIDLDAHALRIQDGIATTDEYRQQFRERLKFRFIQVAKEELELKGSLNFLHVRGSKNAVLVFRVLSADGQHNWFELLVERSAAGPRVVDAFNFGTGENESESSRRYYRASALRRLKTDTELRATPDWDAIERADRLLSINRSIAAGDGKKALVAFDELRADLKKERPFLLTRVQAAMIVREDGAVGTAIEEYEAALPDDLPLLSRAITQYEMVRDHATVAITTRALAAMRKLNERLGGDAYLLTKEGRMLIELEQPAAALGAFDRAADAEADYHPPYFEALVVTLTLQDYSGTAEWLDRGEDQNVWKIDELIDGDKYAGFRASPEGKVWLGERAKKQVKKE